MQKIPRCLAAVGAALALGACSSITPIGAQAPQSYDYALSCKLRQDDPRKCEEQVRALCPDPGKTVVRKSRHVDAEDNNAVVYAYQVSCN